MIFDIVEECYTVSLYNESKSESADKIIDEAADFQDQMLSRIHTAKNNKDFVSIRKDIEDKAEAFIDKLNSLN